MSVTVVPTPGARRTLAEFFALPVSNRPVELVGGSMTMSPSPSFWHQRYLSNLHLLLSPWVDRHGLGVVLLPPMDVLLDDQNVFQPDLLFVAKGSRARLTRKRVVGPPDLVVEVISEGSARRDLVVKRAVYARAGVREFWAFEPLDRLVNIFREPSLGGAPCEVVREPGEVTSPLFPGLRLSLAEIYAHPDVALEEDDGDGPAGP